MNLLGCLDTPTSGSYTLDGARVDGLGKNELAAIRNQKLGFVFQGFNLLARTSAVKNVELPMLYDRSGRKRDTRALAVAALERVGLGDRLDHLPSELSGGQQQRVAIARALVAEPALVLADEPTGNLDSHTTIEVMALFQQLNDQGITIVVVTHEPDVAAYATRIVEMRDGQIVRDQPVTQPAQRGQGPGSARPERGMKLSMVMVGLALQSILKNKTRAMLTMLGIVIGVRRRDRHGRGRLRARSRIREQINNLGTNMIVITPGASTSGGVSQGAQAFATLTLADADKIRNESQTLSAVSPVIIGRSQVIAPGRQLAHLDQRRGYRLPDDPRLADGRAAPSSDPRTFARHAASPCSAARWRSASSPTATPSARRSRSQHSLQGDGRAGAEGTDRERQRLRRRDPDPLHDRVDPPHGQAAHPADPRQHRLAGRHPGRAGGDHGRCCASRTTSAATTRTTSRSAIRPTSPPRRRAARA